MSERPVVALTGATGFVGQALLDEAGRQGIEVRALTRREQPSRDGVEWVRGDLEDRAALAALCKNAEAVLHVAGVVNAHDPMGFHAGNVHGTEQLVEAAREAGVNRIVFVSSLSAREPKLSLYGRSKLHAEQVVEASGLDWTIVRPPAIYGPRDKEMLDLFKAASWGIVPMPPPGRVSMIHVEDLARLILALVPGGEGVSGRILEPDDGREGGWTHAKLARAIGRAVGRERVYAPQLPKGLLLAGSKIDRLFRGRKAKLTPDRVGYMAHPNWVCSTKHRPPSDLWKPKVATRDGLTSTARWYREAGWLRGDRK